MRAEGYETRVVEVVGWPLRLTSYRVGERYHCVADNVDPGAWIARSEGATREEAEREALERAERALGRTRRPPPDRSS